MILVPSTLDLGEYGMERQREASGVCLGSVLGSGQLTLSCLEGTDKASLCCRLKGGLDVQGQGRLLVGGQVPRGQCVQRAYSTVPVTSLGALLGSLHCLGRQVTVTAATGNPAC